MPSKIHCASVALLLLVSVSSQSSEFDRVIWQVSQSDTSEIILQDLKIDGQGRAWMLWKSGHSVFLGSINDEGLTGRTFELIEPFEERRYRTFFLEMAVDSHGQMWCARIDDRNDRYRHRPLLPVDLLRFDEQEMELVRTFEFERFVDSLLFAFAGSEPYLLSEYDDFYWELLYLNTGKLWGNLHVSWESGYVLGTSQVGSSLAVFLAGPYYYGHGGAYARPFDLLFIDPTNEESRDYFFDAVYGWEEYMGGEDWHAFLDSYFRFLSLGSDGSDRVFVAYEKATGVRPFYWLRQPSPPDSLTQFVVRATEFASGDNLGEWDFGFVRGSSLASMTENVSPPGLFTHREGELDLWILVDQSWRGPFPVAASTSASIKIAADDRDRYWMAWDDSTALYATMVSLSEVVFPTAVTGTMSPAATPSSPALSQNFPNPFNARTIIQIQSPDQAALEIFNLRGQLLRSIPISPGSIQATWDGTDSEGSHAGSGVYLYRLRIDDDHVLPLRRMTLLR